MQTRLTFTLALGLALALGAAGCSTPCQDLGDRICQCESEGQVRNNCKTNVKARVKASAPDGNETSYCSTLLGSCPDPNGNVDACAYMLNTCAGKVACGLALPPPLPGCPGPCTELGQRICQCKAWGKERDDCMVDVVLRAEILAPDVPVNTTCTGQLLTCPDPEADPIPICDEIWTTCEGQVACGISKPAPGGCTPIPVPPRAVVLTSPLHGTPLR